MKKKATWSESAIPMLYQALINGAVLVGTSDTVFGLLAMADQTGFDMLNAIKGRSEKPYLIITGSLCQALELCVQENKQELLHCMQACWPGPVTMIVKAKESVPVYMKSKEGTIAIRVPDHKGLKMLLEKIPYLFSTSANRAGEPVPQRAQDLDSSIIEQSIHVVVEEQESEQPAAPSTIIDCTQMPFKVVREGAVTFQELKNKCEDII